MFDVNVWTIILIRADWNRTKKEYIIVNLIKGSTQSSNQLSRLKKLC